MVEVIWSNQAIKDVDRIAEFISKDSEHYAQIQVQRLFDATKVLARYPLFGKIVPERKNENLREILSGSYRIIYQVTSDFEVNIVTVHHNKRLLSNNPNLK